MTEGCLGGDVANGLAPINGLHSIPGVTFGAKTVQLLVSLSTKRNLQRKL